MKSASVVALVLFWLAAASPSMHMAHAQPVPISSPAVSTAQRASTLLSAGRSALRAGDTFGALRAIAMAHNLQPDRLEIRRALADVLVELGANQQAAQIMGPDADLGLRSRQVTEEIHWGEQIEPRDLAYRFETTDAAIAKLEALLAEASNASPVDQGLVTRLRRDLITALRNRQRWADVMAQAQLLHLSGEAQPAYVRRAEADALLELRRPHEARQAFQEVLDAFPMSRFALVGRFYAELEDEDFDAAIATADTLAGQGGPMKQAGRVSEPQIDHDWLDNQVLAARARRYADMPGQAWDRVKPLADAAPASPDLRAEVGEIAAARDWPRLSQRELYIAASLVRASTDIDIALAESQLRRRQWAAAQIHIERLESMYPGNERLQRLRNDFDAYRMAELLMDIEPRRAWGQAALAPGDGLTARLRVYSRPLSEHWRLIGDMERDTGKADERWLVRDRFGGGIEGRWPDLNVELLGWANKGALTRPSTALHAAWRPDDHWTLSARLDAFSRQTPLRAVDQGIWADGLELSTDYHWHESRAASLGVQAFDFSDGNQRRSASFTLSQRAWDTPSAKVTLRPSLYASHNTREDAPYFNPKRDISAELEIDIRQRLWRRYERAFGHRLVLSLGGYWQDGFGTNPALRLSYEQIYRIESRTEWRYGAGYSRRFYDGTPERELMLFVRLFQRF